MYAVQNWISTKLTYWFSGRQGKGPPTTMDINVTKQLKNQLQLDVLVKDNKKSSYTEMITRDK